MSIPLDQLLTPRTEREWLNFLTRALDKEGWRLTDAHSGAVGRTLVQIDARALADLSLYVVEIAQAGYIDTATGPWLDWVVRSQYGLERAKAVVAEGEVQFTTAPGFGPYTLRVPTWLSAQTRLLYSTTELVTVPAGGSAVAHVRAEWPGASYNVGPDAINAMLTPLPGLSVTNGPEWITRAGADAETDARLRERARLRWAELGTGSTRDAYVSWALNASPSVSKVGVLDMNPRGPGTVDVVLAGDGGAVGNDVVAEVNAVVQARRPLTSNVHVYSATPHAIALTGTVYCQAQYMAQAKLDAAQRMEAYQRALPVGATIYRNALVSLFMGAVGCDPLKGVVNIELNAPAADVQLGDVDVAVFSAAGLTWVAV